jgi:glycogen phosphorylase
MSQPNERAPVASLDDEKRSFDNLLIFDHVVDPKSATDRQRFEALSSSIRDLLTGQWLKTRQWYDAKNPKQVYYISIEYLLGRSLTNNISNLLAQPMVHDLMNREKLDFQALADTEPDAGLGNGGLGRLAACYLDSLATLHIPAVGYGLRYEYGMFRQEIKNGYQIECPDNWLRQPDPWEVPRPGDLVQTTINSSLQFEEGGTSISGAHPSTLLGIPYDRPIVGYGGKTINTLRLWEASAPDYFDLNEFNHGDFFGAVQEKVLAGNISRVLYPDDATSPGKHLRFLQEFFLVACSLADILRNFRKGNNDLHTLPNKVAIQLNDTHPSMAVAELMRLLLDESHLGWDEAWDLTVRTLAFTNHTLLPESLEKWPVEFFELALPRQLEIIYEINRRFLNDVTARFGGDQNKIRNMSLIEEGSAKQVRMANLAIVGTHSTNGVSEIHTQLLRTLTFKDFVDMFPDRFNNKTNGVTPRRWLLQSNPPLSQLITESIGDAWITDLSQLSKLKPLAQDSAFRSKFRAAKRAAKLKFVDWLKSATNQQVDPDSIFDCQIKRIHEYKRQLMNVLRIIIIYNRLKQNPRLTMPSRTIFFAGKSAPAYQIAKLIIKLINNVAEVIDNDPVTRGRLKVLFLDEYNVTLAQRLIPASDVSEQISTAGYEASGTSNMKFMMNGALTVGTRDGATIEMAQEAGEENFFLFGLTADQVATSRPWYNPHWHYDHEPETRQALDMISSDYFSAQEPKIFGPIMDTLLGPGNDFFMNLADLTAYVSTQSKVNDLYQDQENWSRKAILNVASSGKFSSDRAVSQYASEIWHATASVPSPATAGEG